MAAALSLARQERYSLPLLGCVPYKLHARMWYTEAALPTQPNPECTTEPAHEPREEEEEEEEEACDWDPSVVRLPKRLPKRELEAPIFLRDQVAAWLERDDTHHPDFGHCMGKHFGGGG